MRQVSRVKIWAVVAVLIWLGAFPATSSGSVTITLGTEFSGSTQPTGTVDLIFANSGTDTVTLTVNNLITDTGSFLSNLYLNFEPEASVGFLVFTQSGTDTAPTAGINLGTNAYKADGDGKYDIKLAFPTSASDDRFTTGESAIFTITGVSGLTADDFYYLSLPDGGHGPFLAAAHIQGLGVDNSLSGFIAPVPEPTSVATWALLAMCGVGPTCWRRRKLHRAS